MTCAPTWIRLQTTAFPNWFSFAVTIFLTLPWGYIVKMRELPTSAAHQGFGWNGAAASFWIKTFSLGMVVNECTPTRRETEPQSPVGTCFVDVAASAGLKRISHCSWIQPHRRSSNSRFRQNFHTDDNSLRHVFFVLGFVRLLYRPRIKASRHFSAFVTSYRLKKHILLIIR
jgi:hypothetical protein